MEGRAVRRTAVVFTVLAIFTGPLPARSQTGSLRPLGLACTPAHGVRFCPGNGTSDRVPSFDGVPLDADVTLPPGGDGPWPVIVLLHGLGGDKTQLQVNVPPDGGLAPRVLPNLKHYNNIFYASRGYAVLAVTLRGFGNSCGGGGVPTSMLQSGPCADGFIRLADTRYEVRDVQHLLGLLVDQGIAKPHRLGATGFSYGGGIAVELAYLKDRIHLPDGRFAPWRSPAGVPMSMGAAYGQWLWSDLIAALLPNGRFLDYDPSTHDSALQPLGV
jgi:predicted esterase